MSKIKIPTDHHYYCHTNNYYSNDGAMDFCCFDDFEGEWMGDDLDIDYNLVFRFDIKEKYDDEDNIIKGKFRAEIFFILQRKGIFRPVTVDNITRKEAKKIIKWLQPHWDYLKDIWSPLS